MCTLDRGWRTRGDLGSLVVSPVDGVRAEQAPKAEPLANTPVKTTAAGLAGSEKWCQKRMLDDYETPYPQILCNSRGLDGEKAKGKWQAENGDAEHICTLAQELQLMPASTIRLERWLA